MDTAPRAFDPGQLPGALAELLVDATLVPISIGESGSVVVLVERPTPERGLVLKLVERGSDAPPLGPEVERATWLSGRFPSAEVVTHGGDDRVEWLVTSALDGQDATATPIATDPGRLARLLGEHLRQLHELDPATCPFGASTASLVAHARSRVEAGRVDPDDFQPIHHGLTPAELLDLVESSVPEEPEDPVVTHGDYCLPNVVLRADGTLAGLVDVGLLGVGDRYRDLGIGARSVARNLGGTAVGAFIEGYGIERPDLARLDAFVMIDELF